MPALRFDEPQLPQRDGAVALAEEPLQWVDALKVIVGMGKELMHTLTVLYM